MKKTILSALLCLLALSTQATTITYQSDTAIFQNPERGYIKQVTRHANGIRYAVKTREYALKDHAKNDQGTLILVLYYLDEFKDKKVLPDSMLDAFDTDMQILRNYGMKAVVRFAYAENKSYTSSGERTADDASLYIIKKHIAQYKKRWEKNKDVIYCFQAGFVGQYGEWCYTTHFTNHVPDLNDSCRALIDTVLKAMPQDRCLLLRRPKFKMQYLDGVALSENEAFGTSKKARLGHFNDSFLYDVDNMGTYDRKDEALRNKERDFIAKETMFVPMGGETNIDTIPYAKKWATYDKTIAEMEKMHWTFIKAGFSKTVTDMWREPGNGTYYELNRRLGYRYQLEKGTYDEIAVQGGQMSINITLKNVGFAPLYNKRVAYIALKNGNRIDTIPLESNPCKWKPNGATTNINEKITIPTNIPAGVYQLYLYLPDYSDSLNNRSEYAIRFANKNVWEASTGMNKLNASVEIKAATPGSYVAVPGILNKSNVASVSVDMTYYKTNYFDYGPKDAMNTGRDATWNINVTKSGEYTVTTTGSYTNGHQWRLILDGDIDHPYTMPSSHKQGETVTETGTTTWYLTKGTHTICVKNIKQWGQPKLLSVELNRVSSAIALPATLNKANVSEVSNDMTYYENDYFDFGPTDAQNTGRWAEWEIQVPSAGNYTISIEGYYTNGHQWQLYLDDKDSCQLSKKYDYGNQIETITWNLPAGKHSLSVKNVKQWGRPKLKSITLTGAANHKPQAIDEVEAQQLDPDAPMYDIMGRRVDASYKGIVIQNNQKYLLW